MDKFRSVLNIANKQTASLSVWLVALLTAGGEQIFSTVVFKCPCSNLNFIYGMVFLLIPALALLILGFILSKKTWKLVTGLCQRTDKVCKSCDRVASFFKILFQITTAALVAPITWIAVSLLNGNVIECAMTGTNITLFNTHLCKGVKMEDECVKELHTFPCKRDGIVPKDVRDQVLLTLLAESQIVGWVLIGSIIIFLLLFRCVASCWSPISYLQLKFWRVYTQKESSQLDHHITTHAQELADRNIKSFFEETPPKEMHTPSKKAWAQISSLYQHHNKNQCYSTLHRYVENPERLMSAASVRSTESHHPVPAALGFVDDGPMSL